VLEQAVWPVGLNRAPEREPAKINLTIEREKNNHIRVYGLPSCKLIVSVITITRTL
jgi:hypothetical protein